jgi:galactofuranose transport system permease protein
MIRLSAKHIPLLATAVVLVLLYAAGAIRYGDRGFASLYSLKMLLEDNSYLGIAAIGMTFVILSGGIDLSVGSIVAFTSIFVAKMIMLGYHPLEAIAMALAIGAGFGAVQGALIHFYRQPAFLITLAGMFFARGMGYIVHGQDLKINHEFYARTIHDWSIPMGGNLKLGLIAVIFIVCLLGGIFIAHFTRFGRAAYAIGDDEQSATLMGIPVGRTRILIYTQSGLLAALAGVVSTFYLGSGWANNAIGFELDAIAAVVIGGTLLTGGVGFVAGTAMGVLILGLIQNIIAFQGTLSPWWTKIVVGLLLLLFIILQNVVMLFSARRRGPGAGKAGPAGRRGFAAVPASNAGPPPR